LMVSFMGMSQVNTAVRFLQNPDFRWCTADHKWYERMPRRKIRTVTAPSLPSRSPLRYCLYKNLNL